MDGLTATRPAGSERAGGYRDGRSAVRILRPQPTRREAAPRARAPRRCCAAACDSPTAGFQPARCRRNATARCSSGCCTPRPASGSSSRPAADARRHARLTAAATPSTTCRAAPAARASWLQALLAHAEQIVAGELRARAVRRGRARRPSSASPHGPRPRGNKHAVAATRFLWIDVDRPDRLGALWSFLAERPCHLLIQSGGSGGVHAYWKLAAPLPATCLAHGPEASRSNAPTRGSSTPLASTPKAGRRSRTRSAASAPA